jgi:hypothetical protein
VRAAVSLAVAEAVLRAALLVPDVARLPQDACACDAGRRLTWYQTRWSWLRRPSDDAHPVLGWVHRAGEDGVNDAGYRDGAPFPPPEPGGRVALLGDSFAWGHGLPVEASLGPLLRQRLGAPVVNLGVSGFAHDQMALRLEAEAPAVQPALVVLLAVSCDVSRNASRFEVFAKPWLDEAGAVHGVPVPAPTTLAWRMLATPRLWDLGEAWWHVATRDPEARQAAWDAATEVALDRVAAAATTAGARLLLVEAPMPEDLERRRRGATERPGAVYARWCASRGADCVDLTPAIDAAVTDLAAFTAGTHWCAAGTALVADGIAAAARERLP